MATIGTSATLQDFARREDPNGKITKVIELLATQNEILTDMRFVEGNLPTGHRTTVRAGLPSATWRKLNYGVVPSKSVTKQVDDTCGMLEAYAEVDKALADLNGNASAWRLSEDMAFLEAMNQDMATAVFYGDTDNNPEQFMGLAPRFNSLSATNGGQIVNAGGSGSTNTSVWLVYWGDQTTHGIFPKGSKAGFSHEDLGRVTLGDSTNGYYEGYRSHYKWDIGLTVRDWRYVVRVANIDVALLSDTGSTGADLINRLIDATEIPYSTGMGTPAMYCNKTIRGYLRKQVLSRDNVNLSWETVAGKKVLLFDDIPVRRCDALVNTETTVS
jgi:hypothetical protein